MRTFLGDQTALTRAPSYPRLTRSGTTIVTFLMVFLIQNTQNRDSSALHLKLNELIRVSERARNRLLDLEDLTEADWTI